MVKDDLIIKIYRRLAKKRYLRGKHTYEYERIYVPIPSRLHDIVRPFLNQRLKISITRQNDGLTITTYAYFFGDKDKEVNFRLVSGTQISCHVYCCGRPISHRSVSCNSRQLISTGLKSTHSESSSICRRQAKKTEIRDDDNYKTS